MLAFKKKYFFIIQNIEDINLNNIKKKNKFVIILRNQKSNDWEKYRPKIVLAEVLAKDQQDLQDNALAALG